MRYIDADYFKERVVLWADNPERSAFAKSFAELLCDVIDEIPTADVAPKSEVAKLQSQVNRLKKYDEERDIALHAKLIANAKAEVAREIFAEIEELAKIYTFPVVKNGVVEIAKEPFWCIEPSDLAELKKKYIGEQK